MVLKVEFCWALELFCLIISECKTHIFYKVLLRNLDEFNNLLCFCDPIFLVLSLLSFLGVLFVFFFYLF